MPPEPPRRPSTPTRAAALAALAWQVELGADEAIGEAPVDRFEALERAPRPGAAIAAAPAPAPAPARRRALGTAALAAACADLAALRAAMAGFEGCALKHGARNLVFADGNPAARVMVIGEAPGRDEDLRRAAVRRALGAAARPDAGGDRAVAGGRRSRRAAVYITNVLPWRPPQNREPVGRRGGDAAAVPLPAHRARRPRGAAARRLAGGAGRCSATADGITRMRGRWLDWRGVPVIATFHPAALLRDGTKKREAWADLLALKARLDGRRLTRAARSCRCGSPC